MARLQQREELVLQARKEQDALANAQVSTYIRE